MAKVKVVTNNLDYNLNREEFTDFPSQTIFSFGRFAVTSNFDGREFIDYSNRLSSFVTPITLDTLNLTDNQSKIVEKKTNDWGLNLDNSNFSKFVRFGSAYEYLRVSVEEIISKYVGSIYVNNQNSGGVTIFNFNFNPQLNISTFYVPQNVMVNNFGIITLIGNNEILNDNILRNLNLSFNDYVVWSNDGELNNVIAPIIGFTGHTLTNPYIILQTQGNPFEGVFQSIPYSGANISFHIKPNSIKFEEFRQQLTDYQKYMISSRNNNGFIFEIKEPILLDNGNIEYNSVNLVWPTSDDYNINFSGVSYRNFLDRLMGIGGKYDAIKTDLIARFLTPSSLKKYDLTEDGKINKLLRAYGWEFDQLRLFIDSLAYVNRITYDKKNNIPDKLVKNFAKLLGWEYFSLVSDSSLVDSLLTIDDVENDLHDDYLPVEIDIELWRRIILNTNYLWKAKGTREAINAILLMIGIPSSFININEYIYTVSDKINPNSVELQPMDFPSNSYPFDEYGYPIAPKESNDFYFQISGNSDSGQAYLDNFRLAGFKIERKIDNVKSWVEDGEIVRQHPSTIQYNQKDSKLILNTKEINVALDASRGIEVDVFDYLQKDYVANSVGFALPISYVNLSIAHGVGQNTFTLPSKYNNAEGDVEVRWNGILLNAPSSGNSTQLSNADYFINGNQITIPALTQLTNTTDSNVLQVSYIYKDITSPITDIVANYIVTRIRPDITGTKITLPSMSSGDVQLTINGIALTKKTTQFNGDYYVDNSISGQTVIIITNPSVIAYFLDGGNNPSIQVTYVEVMGSMLAEARSEIHRVDGFGGNKFYFNSFANRFVYVLNHKINNVENIKVLVDGIAIEPNNDYVINPNNPFEIYLPRTIKFGSIISIYYLIGGVGYFNAIVDDVFGLGDISQLSFIEFSDLVIRRMINAKNRKIITDFNGGWYPTLLKLYNEYLKRGKLTENNPLRSNAYSFQILFEFLSKYNSFFERFVKQLLSSTIILEKSGLLVRNSLFTRQKFTYKTGVAFNYKTDRSFNRELNYLGDSGSMFLIPQQSTIITPSLNTIVGDSGIAFDTYTNRYIFSINITGGNNIVMFDAAQRFGVQYMRVGDVNWIDSPTPPYNKSLWDGINPPITPSVTNNSFTLHNIGNLLPNTVYEYRAFIEVNGIRTYGQVVQTRTPAMPLPQPSVRTIGGSAVRVEVPYSNTHNFILSGTGGNNIVRTQDVSFYGILHKLSMQTWEQASCVERSVSTSPIVNNQYSMNVGGLSASTTYDYRAYITVEGVKICGASHTVTMLGFPQTVPTTTTGRATNVTQTSMNITGNTLTSSGNAPILEGGVLWTHVPALSSAANLVWGASGVNNSITGGTIGVNVPFSSELNGLPSNTQTWYRSAVRNSVGWGYGTIRSQMTCTPPPPPPVGLSFSRISQERNPNDNTHACAFLGVSNYNQLAHSINSIGFTYAMAAVSHGNMPVGTYTSLDFIYENIFSCHVHICAQPGSGLVCCHNGAITINEPNIDVSKIYIIANYNHDPVSTLCCNTGSFSVRISGATMDGGSIGLGGIINFQGSSGNPPSIS